MGHGQFRAAGETDKEMDMNPKRMLPISGNARAQSGEAEVPMQFRSPYLTLVLAAGLALSVILTTAIQAASATPDADRKTVAALDTEYQSAVKANDATTMARILADDFVLVTGSGKTYTKADMLEDARRGDVYQQNDEESQTVRVWGDTAVVTAKLWEKYTSNGKSYDHKFWFSDTYVRTPAGWKYVFGQSSLALPNGAS
jgi:ketosteroid isomerase-like protein